MRARSAWLSLPSDATLEDLHYTIHRVWGLERPYGDTWLREDPDDHAHGFWLSGKPWVGDGYTGSFMMEEFVDPDGLPDTRIKLADLDLTLKQKIAYVYDFGTEARLELTVEGVPALDVIRSSS